MIDLDTAELSILGSVLLTNGRALDEIDFAPTDYRHPNLELVHRTMSRMKSEGKAIDPLTVGDEIMRGGEKLDPLLLHKAMDVTPTAANIEYYANIVADAASLRRLGVAADRVKQMTNAGGDADMILEEARREIDGARSVARAQPVRSVEETLEETIDFLSAPIVSTATPWPSLNKIINGLKPGALYVVGARPSVGKSVVGLQLARGLTDHGTVAFMSLEMSVIDVNTRLISADTGIDMGVLMRHQLNEHDYTKISKWMGGNVNKNLFTNDNTGASITDVQRFVRNVSRRGNLSGVVVDYLQLMSQQPGDKRPRHEFVADLSRQLKIMAMELDVPVIALSQLNRGSTSRDDQRPKISDLRESGAVEQDADVVILLHREIDTENKYEIDMLVGKNRHGPTGATSMAFIGHNARIEDR